MRRELEALIQKKGCVPAFLSGLQDQSKACPFSENVLQDTRECMQAWLQSQGIKVELDILPDQPFLLDLMSGLLKVCDDPDSDLPSLLKAGVDTGVLEPIPKSGVWRTNVSVDAPCVELAECSSNWKSADDDLALAQSLVDEDVNDGFVREFKGSLQDAKAKWPRGVAVGKLGIAHAPGRAPRLIMDSTVAGVNPAAVIEDKLFLPGLRDVVDTTDPDDPATLAFSMDVSKAHKRVRVREAEQGLLLFGLKGVLYHYVTCHFGATFSAYWWGRCGASLHRLLHRLLWSWHAGFLYVDDWLWRLCKRVAPLQATLLALFLTALGCP